MKKPTLFDLFKTFFTLGLVTFGGGLAMLPFIKKKALSNNWITEKEWRDYVAIVSITPGAIAVNISHLIGYRVRGILGGLISVFGMILPSILVITAIALGLEPYFQDPTFIKIIRGIFLVVIAFMSKALIEFILSDYRTWYQWVFGVLAGGFLVLAWLDPSQVLIATVLLALVFHGVKKKT